MTLEGFAQVNPESKLIFRPYLTELQHGMYIHVILLNFLPVANFLVILGRGHILRPAPLGVVHACTGEVDGFCVNLQESL